MNAKFPKLFEPGLIGKLEVKNRLIKAPTHTGYAGRDGAVTDRLLRHYREIARGGVGLIIMEYCYIDNKASKSHNCQLGISDDEFLPGLAWLATAIQENGAKAGLQLAHGGRQVFLPYLPAKMPSRVPWEAMLARGAPVPQELTFEETVEIVQAFGDAALRAKQAGYDLVELHAGHGYLITQFLSPYTNHRTDWYGGSLKNRMRFLMEIVDNVRKKVGDDYPLSVRLSGSEYIPGGLEIDDTIQIAKALQDRGGDILHMSGGIHQTTDKQLSPIYWPQAYNIWAAEAVKKAVSLPIIGSGSINTPELAEQILEEGKADFISLGRPLLVDPYFPQKAKEGRSEDIRPCIRGCHGCVFTPTGVVTCEINPMVGNEGELPLTPAIKSKKVVVVGGGPAGMEAAAIATSRGHRVTIFEKRKLGGRLFEASFPDFKADIKLLIRYLVTQVEKAGIPVIFEEATAEKILASQPDAVILAAGAAPVVIDVPGLDKSLVRGALDILNGAKTGQEVVIIGGGMVGSEIALLLGEQGKKVTIVEMLAKITPMPEERKGPRNAYFERLAKCQYPLKVMTETRLEAIMDTGVIVSARDGRKSELKANNVVLALGFRADKSLYNELKTHEGLEVYTVGDYVKPREIYDAIHEGSAIARLI